MDITVYLPDNIGERAKRESDINLSRMLRDALLDEFTRRDAMSTALQNVATYVFDFEDEHGHVFAGRIVGAEIARNRESDVAVYLTDDARVIVCDGYASKYWVLPDPEDGLRTHPGLGRDAYLDACKALGIKPVVDL